MVVLPFSNLIITCYCIFAILESVTNCNDGATYIIYDFEIINIFPSEKKNYFS